MASSLRARLFWFLPFVLISLAVTGAMTFNRWRSSQSSSGPLGEPGRNATSAVPEGSGAIAAGDYPLTDITEELGIQFVHEPGFPSFFLPEIMGSGVALFDYDQDGRLDIYLRNATPGPPHPLGTADTQHAYSRLYHQRPDGKFEDVTESAGLKFPDFGTGVAIGDINNDGFPDIYAVNLGRDRLFLNRRDGTFCNITESAGINDSLWGASAAFLDFDRDGRLDIFVVNYLNYANPKHCEMANGRRDYCHPRFFPPTAAKLYRNVTDIAAARENPEAIQFEDVSESSGIASKLGPGLGVRPIDFDDDGWPDIYVANDSAANFLWMNQRDGTFRELALPLGAAYDSLGRPQASMGIAEGDVDGDGQPDLVITNYRGEGSVVYRKRPVAFEDYTSASGLLVPSFSHTGFGIALADFDHDGTLDIAVANGSVVQREDRLPVALPSPSERNSVAVAQFWKAYAEPHQFFINDGHGRFKDVSAETGSFARVEEVARGLAVGDLDGDGDLDLVLTNVAGPARVYRNDIPKRGHWLMLRVIDPALGGRDAYGALVTVITPEKRFTRRVQPASSYLSSDDPRVHFGLGSVDRIDRLQVKWPDGALEQFPGGSVDLHRVLRRGEGNANE